MYFLMVVSTLTTVSFFSDAKRTFSGYERKHFYPFVNKMTNYQQWFLIFKDKK